MILYKPNMRGEEEFDNKIFEFNGFDDMKEFIIKTYYIEFKKEDINIYLYNSLGDKKLGWNKVYCIEARNYIIGLCTDDYKPNYKDIYEENLNK